MNLIKPVISYYSNGDPTTNFSWVSKLTDINIIRTKNLSEQFNTICLENKNKIFLHLIINGMGQTMFEPNIPSVKYIFVVLADLIKRGFPQNQILVIIDPIICNQNGLKALQLLLKIFSEFRYLKLRYVRVKLLGYWRNDEKYNKFSNFHKTSITENVNHYNIANSNIRNRIELNQNKNEINKILKFDSSFHKQYYILLQQYKPIIFVDKGEEPLIGRRELQPFGFLNQYKNELNETLPLITYSDNKKEKPNNLNIISELNHKGKKIQCNNKCILCPFENK